MVKNGSREIKAIIFDLGNVLIDFDHWIAAQRISRFTDKKPIEIFHLFFDSELTALFEEGKISPLDFFSKVKDTLNLRLDYDGFLPIWNEVFFFTEENKKVYDLALSLKARIKVALLSNVNILHFEYIKKTFPVLGIFHNIITSFELGFRKPKPEIYQKTLEILGVSAENVFYTDDRPELIESARSLGIRGLVFRDAKHLEENILATGLNNKLT